MGFKPDDVNGKMYDKKYYGLKVPDTEDFDEMNAVKLRHEGRLPSKPGVPTFNFDGYRRVNVGRIPRAVQNQYNDNGRVAKIEPSHTFSGHARKKHGRGKA